MLPGKKYGIQDVVAIAKRRWWLLPGPVVLACFVSLVVASKVRDRYQSEMLIQIVPGRVPDRMVPNGIEGRAEDRMASLQAQVKSRSELEKLIKEFGLYKPQLAVMPLTDVVDIMRNDILVEMVRSNRMLPPDSFYVRFIYTEPAVASRVTARLGSLFVDKNADERIELADNTSEFIASHLADAKARLVQHEQKMEQFRQRNAGRLPTQTEANLQVIQNTQAQLQSQLEGAARDRDRRMMLERLYNEALAEPVPMSPAAAAAPSDATTFAALPAQQQLDVARKNLAVLQMRLQPEHPDVRRAQRLISDLEKQVESAPSAAPAATPSVPTVTFEAQARAETLRLKKAEIESLDRQIAFRDREQERLKQVIADYQRRLESTPGVESEWIALTRDYETLNATYKSLLLKSEDSAMTGDLEKRRISEQFRVLDPARVPVRPVGPVRLKINAIGFGIGLVIGLALIALSEVIDTTFRTEGDVLDVLSLPVLAVVPLVRTEEDVRLQQHRRRLATAAIAIVAVGGAVAFWSLELWKHVV